jgi:hypothetical protein
MMMVPVPVRWTSGTGADAMKSAPNTRQDRAGAGPPQAPQAREPEAADRANSRLSIQGPWASPVHWAPLSEPDDVVPSAGGGQAVQKRYQGVSGRPCADDVVTLDASQHGLHEHAQHGCGASNGRRARQHERLAHPLLSTWAVLQIRRSSCSFMHQVSCTCSVLHRPACFRFRYRKVWGFKSLLVHYSETIREVGEPNIDS